VLGALLASESEEWFWVSASSGKNLPGWRRCGGGRSKGCGWGRNGHRRDPRAALMLAARAAVTGEAQAGGESAGVDLASLWASTYEDSGGEGVPGGSPGVGDLQGAPVPEANEPVTEEAQLADMGAGLPDPVALVIPADESSD